MTTTPKVPLSSAAAPGRLRLKHIFYATAVVAASLRIFGWFGLFVGSAIAAAWYHVYLSKSASSCLGRALEASVVIVLPSMLCLCVIPAVSHPRSVARRMQCAGNEKQILLAMHNYHASHGSLPPAITYDSDGRAMHSWRVLLLPFLEEGQLFERYNMDEPWDGPNNSQMLASCPRVYRCPLHEPHAGTTTYNVVVGERTCFPSNGSCSFKDISDGTANTILLVEHAPGVPWTAPRDVSLDEFNQVATTWGPKNLPPHATSDLISINYSGGNLGFADGAVRSLGECRDKDLWRRLLQIDDGGPSSAELDELVFGRHATSYSVARSEGYFSIGTFLLLCVLPAFWLRTK